MSDQDATRRQAEISAFAAMALGEEGGGGNTMKLVQEETSSTNATSANPASQKVTAATATNATTTVVATPPNASQEAFRQAVQASNEAAQPSGTFDFTPAKVPQAGKGALAAAAAALERQPAPPVVTRRVSSSNTTTAAVPPTTTSNHPTAPPVDLAESPMFIQRLSMPRPLFFGTQLPPRVVQQSRTLVRQAFEDCGYTLPSGKEGADHTIMPPPSVRSLPAGIRNLIGALRTYGGIDLVADLLENDKPATTKDDWARVTTYQPVWGETERRQRIQQVNAAYQQQRPSTISQRSVTAPANLAGTPHAVAGDVSSTMTMNNTTEVDANSSANQQFSQWLRGREEDGVASPMAGNMSEHGGNSSFVLDGSSASLLLDDATTEEEASEHGVAATTSDPAAARPSERETFAKWAQGSGGASSGTMVTDGTSLTSSAFDNSTFQRRPPPVVVDSDDDSIDYDEEKKQVGLNDHMSKALASLVEQSSAPDVPELERQVLLSQVTDGSKRPLTNYEVTGGCVPFFGVDDPPLPVEADLGIHETKDEQQRYLEVKRSQDVVEKFVAPNVFGSIACPNPALNPDDFHSWNTRATATQRMPPTGSIESLSLPSFAQPTPRYRSEGSDNRSRKDGKRYRSRTRYGWWNIGKEEDWPATITKEKEGSVHSGQKETADTQGGTVQEPEAVTAAAPPPGDTLRQLPPTHHSGTALQVVTALEPTPGQLQRENLPLSRMDAATSAAQTLPYLSDRPPSYRYLQIDTQGVAFPPVGGEVEPLFCTLAIYNVETVSSVGHHPGENSVAPVPDLQRCGRVTEALSFDTLRDRDLESQFHHALWPYDPKSSFSKVVSNNVETNQEQRVGTRCGVFPLPSNLNFSNLYAVLIVHKVISEDSLDAYLKPSSTPIDTEKLRDSAERSSRKYAPFLLPFAFGVAPLMQVFAGLENPVITSSRAVQIPLFRFSPGLGQKQIIDHIMVMLNPRADRRAAGASGPASPTNGGTAMLIMRSFGFLGLHQVVDSTSNLARDRLVDFTGELQLRRSDVAHETEPTTIHDEFSTRLPDWATNYIAEPTVEGGRSPTKPDATKPYESSKYAQELAPRSLQASKLARMAAPVPPSAHRGRLRGGQDIEPVYFTSFCNEMLFHPRLLHNCPRGNIVVKAEMREIEWNGDASAYFAYLPQIGPAMHNNRRGPFLVQSLFTSCSPRGSNKHFMDEFKLKLPLDLRPSDELGNGRRVFAILFTVYNIKLSSKSKWKKLFTATSSEIQDDPESDGRMEQIACGFLPVSTDTCLIDDGLHDVRIVYKAEPARDEFIRQGQVDAGTLVLTEKSEIADSTTHHSLAEDTTVSNDSGKMQDGLRADQSVASASDLTSLAEESVSKSDKQKATDPLSLSVRITCHSSLHVQNETLAEMLQLVSDFPSNGKQMDDVFISKLRMGREFLSSSIESVDSRVPSSLEVKLLESAINIVKSQVCPITHSHEHVFRVFPILWRTLLCGTGEPDLGWVDPAAPIPLRLHTFATILQLLGGISLYLQKNGLMQVDGLTKWNIVALGRVVSLLFDEGKMFGIQSIEAFDKEKWADQTRESEIDRLTGSAVGKKPSPTTRRNRHVRQKLEMLDMLMPNDESDSERSPGKADAVAQPLVGDSLNGETKVPPPPLTNTSDSAEVKVDSKYDFQTALRAGIAVNDDPLVEDDGAKRAAAMIQAFGSGTGSRRWMTAPIRALSTINESEDADDVGVSTATAGVAESITKDQLDSEIHVGGPKKPVKQMRIPKRTNRVHDDAEPALERPKPLTEETRQKSIPQTDQEIESAGSAFLDVIGKSLGISASARMLASEDQNVGSSHHRKVRSSSSIDWTLIGDCMMSANKENSDESNEAEDSEIMVAVKQEESRAVRLPNFTERLTVAGKLSDKSSRWFPYAYEVVILQWSAILIAQRAAGDKTSDNGKVFPNESQNSPREASSNQSISQAAARSIGVAVAGAPLLFEIIKHSLGFRIHSLFDNVLKGSRSYTSPPLIVLEETLQVALEHVVSMVADACIDSRNFDSLDLRQMSIDVNDSIVRFLRDMFSILSPSSNSRLVLAYLSRFVTKDGKHWQDRDSSIGLRCSWEITKLRLNAVTGLIRFPDFVRINSPQMLNWSRWWKPSLGRSDSFFAGVLQRYRNYRLFRFVSNDNPQTDDVIIPEIHPHWLAEAVIDICLLGTEHIEPQIQQRSAALLHEMFWNSSQDAILSGGAGPVASMYLTFVEKMLSHVNFLANFAPKSQLRKDLLPCVVFVLQSTPSPLLRALWRLLCEELPEKSYLEEYGGFQPDTRNENDTGNGIRRGSEAKPDALDMFKLLNLCLKTIEYEGSDENLGGEDVSHSEAAEHWHREFLLGPENDWTKENGRRRQAQRAENGLSQESYSSSSSRKWHAHDGSLVVINAGHQLVFELYALLHTIPSGQAYLNPAVRKKPTKIDESVSMTMSRLRKEDVVLFIRAATSLYLHALALHGSDIATVRAFKVTAEIIKIFGIKNFLEAVGETLQHWTRVISLHCGARRASVRIEATDLLELILRSTWECYGSFFRIRVPLLAVQTEVMERIVATAATRYYRDQRRQARALEPFTNISAEASLVPLWRTLDRIEKQPASQNVAFRGALVRISRKLKKLYRAYIAARVLSFIQGSRSPRNVDEEAVEDADRDHESESLVRANRISILRVINASEGYSKQFLGFHATTQQQIRVAHFEAVEDALVDAADVFSPTELPEHRVAWLRMLADFHSSRKRFAEEATCHFQIHVTLHQAAQLHGSLWSNTPFFPWTDNSDNPNVDADYITEYGIDENDGQYANINSFRRIFYRVANSVSVAQDYWGTSGRPNLFCGVSSLSEYFTVSPWLPLKAMEEDMVEEAEAAGDLFLSAGIIESSRFSWRLATEYYSQCFNYAKLALAYGNLSRTVVSRVPQIDSSLPQEVSAILGRFYRVWFHGGAPDELNGVEFVYRAEGTVGLDQFGQTLREVIKSILPSDKTPVHLVLDGRSETKIEDTPQNFGFRLGSTPLEPVRIKVTPLRPLFGQDGSSSVRGMPEWFLRYADDAFSEVHHRSTADFGQGGRQKTASGSHHQREHIRSYSASVFSSLGNQGNSLSGRSSGLGEERASRLNVVGEKELSGVDKFCFVQPKDRSRSKIWWKYASGNFADKSLKVTQLQVAQDFPACVARQPVVHRLVYSQSPLEAGIEAVCQWCAVLFRTAVATIGMAVLGTNSDPGIGTDAVKVVIDCIHSSQVKEIGLSLMTKLSDLKEKNSMSDFSLEEHDRLSDREVEKLQLKLARLIIVFFELLHLLITRNRVLLLDVIQERKKSDTVSKETSAKAKTSDSYSISRNKHLKAPGGRSIGSFDMTNHSVGSVQGHHSQGGYHHGRKHAPATDARSTLSLSRHSTADDVRSDDGHRRGGHVRHLSMGQDDQQSTNSLHANNPTNDKRTGSAIAVQGELQRGFIIMAKALYPKVYGIMQSDTPRWFKQCAQDSYFSLGTYKQTKVSIAEELSFAPESLIPPSHSAEMFGVGGSLGPDSPHSRQGSLAGSSHQSVVSRGSERYGFGAF